MAGKLLVRQGRFEVLNQIGGRDHLDSHRADDFDRARIDARDVRDRAAGRIVHRDSARAAERGAQCGNHFVVRTIDDLFGGERVEPMRFDGRYYRARRAAGGDEAEPSTSRDTVAGQAEDSIRERVAHAEIVEQPAVELRVAERAGDFVEALRHESALKRAPQTCTLAGSIFTIGLSSGVMFIARYCKYLSRR